MNPNDELHTRLVEMVQSTEESTSDLMSRYEAGCETDSEGVEIYEALQDYYGVVRSEEFRFCLAGGGPSMFLIVNRRKEYGIEFVRIEANWAGIEPVERDYFPGSAIWAWAEYLTDWMD